MKKTLLVALACAFILSGCTGGAPSSSSSDVSSEIPSSSSIPNSQLQITPPSQDTRPMVADAAMYRGTISNLTDKDFTLTQANGRDFGVFSMNFSIDENTKFNIDKATIKDGMYIEVYYGAPMGKALDYTATQGAIQVNKISDDVNASIYNGEVISIEYEDGSTTKGRILMKPIDSINTNETVFLFSDETQFYINIDDIKIGSELNIFRSQIETRSIPPQTQAYEIKLYENLKIK